MVNQVDILRQKVNDEFKNPKNLLFLTMFTIGIGSILAQLAQSSAATAPIIGPFLTFIFKGIAPGLLGFGVIIKWLLITFVVVTIVNFVQAILESYLDFKTESTFHYVRLVIVEVLLVAILIMIINMLPMLLPGLYKQSIIQSIVGGV